MCWSLKDQYVGDINDFRKYGLIRTLLEGGDLRLFCCWLKTPDDASTDGSSRRYLTEPTRWRDYDPDLFDTLERLSRSHAPGIQQIERSGVLPNAAFMSAVVADRLDRREGYFAEVYGQAATSDVTFFDPDNGFEVRSRARGTKGSSKYIYWDEVVTTYGAGASVLVYQHFPRVERSRFVSQLMRRLRQQTGARWTASFSTSHVLFALAPQDRHRNILADGCRRAQAMWGKQFSIRVHRASLPGLEPDGMGGRVARSFGLRLTTAVEHVATAG